MTRVRITGIPQLEARLHAIQRAPAAYGAAWGEHAIENMRSRTPVRTGATRRSYQLAPGIDRVGIRGSKVAFFIDEGVRPHDERARGGGTMVFPEGGRTVFAKKVHHPGYGAKPFLRRAADDAAREAKWAETVDRLWNGAA